MHSLETIVAMNRHPERYVEGANVSASLDEKHKPMDAGPEPHKVSGPTPGPTADGYRQRWTPSRTLMWVLLCAAVAEAVLVAYIYTVL